MKKRNALLLTLTLATAAFVATQTTDAHAQGRRNRGGQNGAGQNGGGNGFGGGFGGGQFGGRGGFGGGMNANPHDPTKSALPVLLLRPDVQTEIMLSQKQNEEFAAEETTAQAAVAQAWQDARKNMPNRASMQDLSQEEQQAKWQEARQKRTEAITAAQSTMSDTLEKKAETVLRPEQLARARQLDLQWRGPLALTDTKVAAKFTLTDDQKTKLADLLKQSQTEQQTIMREMMNATRQPRQRRNNNNAAGGATAAPTDPNAPAVPAAPPAADPNAPAAVPTLTPEQIQAKRDEAQVKADKVRADYDAKAYALLTDAQKAAWKTAIGAKFTFRQTAAQ